MSEAHEEIRSAGGDVIAVFQYRAQPVRNFCRQRGATVDCYGDPDREAYRELALAEYSAMDFIGPKQALTTLKAATKGHFVGLPKGGDVKQSPGTFVIGSDGRVLLAHYNGDSADNAPMDEVMDAVRKGAGAPA